MKRWIWAGLALVLLAMAACAPPQKNAGEIMPLEPNGSASSPAKADAPATPGPTPTGEPR